MVITYIKYGLAAAIMFVGVFLFAVYAYGAVTFTTPNQSDMYKNFTFFSATTTTATSTNTTDGGGYFVVNGAKKVVMYFIHGGTATTSTAGATFKVQGTRDGTNWVDIKRLLGPDVSATATSTYAIQGATTTDPVALDLEHRTFYAIRCITVQFNANLQGDGEQTCIGSAEF